MSIMSRSTFFFSVKIFKIETFQLRLGCVEIFIEIVEINRDCRDKSRPIETNRDICKKSRFCRDKSRFCRDKSRLCRDKSRHFSLDRDILDFRHLWKVVGEGFTLTFISLPWASPTTFHRFLQLKKISRSRYIKNQVISRSRSRKISRSPEKSQKSRFVSKNLDLD